VFESIVIRNGNILSLNSHLARIFKGIEDIGIVCTLSEDEIRDILIKLCEISEEKDGMIK
jgi:branched-subunit amino acid aminotransferase/4-amino-4-deoxychorismate lyase